MRRAASRLVLAALAAAPAAGSVPPVPPDDAPVIAASCGDAKTVAPFGQVAATVAPLGPETLLVEGSLRRRWGVRITTADPRVADVTGMEFNGRYGLLAVTRAGRWLSFDLRDGTLAGMRSVGVAAMKGAAGIPTSLTTPTGERTYVAFAGPRPVLARYALGACGASSTAVPWIDVSGTADPIVVQAAYGYLGVVGRHGREGGAIVLPYTRTSVALANGNPLARPGRTLVAASNAARIVPAIVVARRAGDGVRAEIGLVTVDGWSDVHDGAPVPEVPLATLPRTPAAIASFYSSRQKTTLIVIALPGPRPGTLDLYAFDSDTRV